LGRDSNERRENWSHRKNTPSNVDVLFQRRVVFGRPFRGKEVEEKKARTNKEDLNLLRKKKHMMHYWFKWLMGGIFGKKRRGNVRQKNKEKKSKVGVQ